MTVSPQMPLGPASAAPAAPIAGGWGWPLLLAAAVTLAYANSFGGVWVFDDGGYILKNHDIREFGLPWKVMGGNTRPVYFVTVMANYALHQYELWGYHAANLAIHLAAVLLLYGLVRRTLLTARLRERYGRDAGRLAFLAALLYGVHPLTTESVTYVYQRTEALAGLFYVLTLYCFTRGATAVGKGGWWFAGAVAACALGMGSKEVMVAAPFLVLLYDRAFLGGSFATALRRRAGVYLALLAGAAILGVLLWTYAAGFHSTKEVGFSSILFTPFEYALTQTQALVHYLRLAIAPYPLCIDYERLKTPGLLEVLPAAAAVGALLLVTLYGLVKNRGWGFMGAWFFLILAPTSSLMPMPDPIVEHRMYAPLMAVVTLLVLGGYEVIRWTCRNREASVHRARLESGALLALLVAGIFGMLTHLRNRDYHSREALWQAAIRVSPGNQRAWNNLGVAYRDTEQYDKAFECFTKTLALKANYPEGHHNLGRELARRGRHDEALSHYRAALKSDPNLATAHLHLGIELARRGRYDEAMSHYRASLRSDSQESLTYYNAGNLLLRTENYERAIWAYRQALQRNDRHGRSHYNLGVALEDLKRIAEALAAYRAAVRVQPEDEELRLLVGIALTRLGKLAGAAEQFAYILQQNPRQAVAHNNLGCVLARQGKRGDAIRHLTEATRLRGDYLAAHEALATLLEQAGKQEAARQHRRIAKALRARKP